MNKNDYGKVEEYEIFGELNLIEDDIELLKIDTEISQEDKKELLNDYEPYSNKKNRITWAIKDGFCGVILVDENDNVIDRICY